MAFRWPDSLLKGKIIGKLLNPVCEFGLKFSYCALAASQIMSVEVPVKENNQITGLKEKGR